MARKHSDNTQRSPHDAWAHAVLTAMGIERSQRQDEKLVAMGGKRVDAVVDFVSRRPPSLFGPLAQALAGRWVGFEFYSGGLDLRAWVDGYVKTGLLFLHERASAGRKVAVVTTCVATPGHFVDALRRYTKPGPWPSGSWCLRIFDDIDYWVLDTERLPEGEGASAWRVFTHLRRLEDGRIGRLPDDRGLKDADVKTMRDRLVDALEQQGHHDLYRLTARQIEERGLQQGIQQGLQQGRRGELLAIARELLGARAADELAKLDDVELLHAELVRRLAATRRA